VISHFTRFTILLVITCNRSRFSFRGQLSWLLGANQRALAHKDQKYIKFWSLDGVKDAKWRGNLVERGRGSTESRDGNLNNGKWNEVLASLLNLSQYCVLKRISRLFHYLFIMLLREERVASKSRNNSVNKLAFCDESKSHCGASAFLKLIWWF